MADHPHLALCLGGAPSVWDDLERARRLTRGLPVVIVAANHIGCVFDGHLDAWVTLHPEMFQPWRDERAAKGLNTDYRALVYNGRAKIEGAEPYRQRWNGSSGLFAAQLSLDVLGCAGVILCGVPIDRKAGHFYHPGEWLLADRYRPGFVEAKAEGAPIRSMGGWTAEVMGEPSSSWLLSLGFNVPTARKLVRPREKEIAMRIKMLTTHSYVPPAERRISVKYLEGQEYTVKRSWGEAMVAGKVAKEVRPPRKSEADA